MDTIFGVPETLTTSSPTHTRTIFVLHSTKRLLFAIDSLDGGAMLLSRFAAADTERDHHDEQSLAIARATSLGDYQP